MRRNMLRIFELILIITISCIALSINTYAQDDRGEHHDNGRHEGWHKHQEEDHHDEGLHQGWYKHNDKAEWERRDDDYREVRYRDRHYFYHRGEFYERRPEGYVEIDAPVGVAVTYIPRGYKVIRHSGIRFYLFGGIYYRYNPTTKFYLVVRAPF